MTDTRPIRILLPMLGLLALALPAAAQAPNFDDPKEFDAQRKLMSVKPEGPDGQPWLQRLGGGMVDTGKFKKPGPYKVCFSNAGVGNPWRVVGFNTMKAEVALHPEIKDFIVTDAEGKDDKQIADINDLLSGDRCDVLVVSPNTTAALTPAVEKACAKLPVVVFDRGVQTSCPVTFVTPIGGYAYGIRAAEFIAQNVPKGGNVLALRILPGVDVLENRWAAANHIFKEAGLTVVGQVFTDGDRAKTKSIVEDYLNRGTKLDAVFMDAGATSVAAIEAFEDAGKTVPVITGEDQQDFLLKWKQSKLTAIAPTYPTFQWRTAIIAATNVLKGEPVPGPVWSLPQPAITAENLDQYANPAMPPLHYALCGCESMPGYPEKWGGKK